MTQAEEIKQKTDIITIIGDRVQLTKAGRNFRGVCPFHTEKTPSFMVSPELQMFKCFGCQEGGDVFAFLEKYEGMDFPETLKYLADKLGIKLETRSPQKTEQKEFISEINELAYKFYHYILVKHDLGKRALIYFEVERGLSQESIKTFNLGFAPDNSQSLFAFLQKKGFTPEQMLKAGVVVESKGRFFDRFRGRVIFPIFDHKDSIIALAGRVLPEIEKASKFPLPKYINSPETAIYHKSQSLYGINIAKQFIKEYDAAIIVEGEIDLISSFQAGIKNVVAIKGSALTEEQLRLLARFTKNITLALDSDFAGNAAAVRGIKIASDLGFAIKVVNIVGYKDPDEAARGNPEAFQKMISQAVVVWDFLIKMVFDKYEDMSGADKAKISQEVIPFLAMISDKIVQSHYIQMVASQLSVPFESVVDQLRKVGNPQVQASETVKVEISPEILTRRQNLEKNLLGLLLTSESNVLPVSDFSKLFQDSSNKKLISMFEGDLKAFAEFVPEHLKQILADSVFGVEAKDDADFIKGEIGKTVREIVLLDLKLQLGNESKSISRSEIANNADELLTAEKTLDKLSKKLLLAKTTNPLDAQGLKSIIELI